MRRIMLWPLVLLIILMTVPVMGASRPDAPPYGLRGAHPVGAQEFSIPDDDRPLHGTVWYPALNPDELPEEIAYTELLARVDGHALRDAAPDADGGPYPLIVFSHGLGGARFQSAYYVEHLASYGFVVMAVEHPGSTFVEVIQKTLTLESIIQGFGYRPLEVLRVIEFAETLTGEGGVLEGVIDLENIGLTGHSFGGYTAMATGGARLELNLLEESCLESTDQDVEHDAAQCLENFAELIAGTRNLENVPSGLWPPTTDPRIKAVVAQAPAEAILFGENGLADMDVPTMIQVGSLDDRTPPEEDANRYYDGISSQQKTLVTFDNAGHYIFVEECTPQMISFGYFDSCSDKVWDMARAHDLINHFATAFFLAALKDDPDGWSVLDPAEVDFPGIDYQTTAP